MKRFLPFITLFFVLANCSARETVKPSPVAPMGNYSSITVAKFVSPEPAIGQRVAERLAVKLSAVGYAVTRRWSAFKKAVARRRRTN